MSTEAKYQKLSAAIWDYFSAEDNSVIGDGFMTKVIVIAEFQPQDPDGMWMRYIFSRAPGGESLAPWEIKGLIQHATDCYRDSELLARANGQ